MRTSLRWWSVVFAAGLLPGLIGSSMPPLVPAAFVPICSIQGTYFSSPRLGQTVTTSGVVTLDLDSTSRRGFYIQKADCDANPNTSNGLFVFLPQRGDLVSAGDFVNVTGVVEEYYGRTELNVAVDQVQVISHANPLPQAVELAPPFDSQAARVYFERLEGMLARLSAGLVVGPTDADERTWLVRGDLGRTRIFAGEPDERGALICADDTGLASITPAAAVGDRVNDLQGVIDYRIGVYCLDLESPPALVAQPLAPLPSAPAAPALSLATFNLSNLFDDRDDPLVDDEVLSSPEYQRRLYKRAWAMHAALGEPAFIGVQEVESAAVLDALVHDPDVLQADYQPLLLDGPDSRGLDVGLLYRPDQVWPFEAAARQGCTALIDGLGPDGNGDPQNPANAQTCDRDGDGLLDGNRLFSRPPLVVRLRLESVRTLREIVVIVNHWKSQVEDSVFAQVTQPRRIEQARFVADLADEILALHPGVDVFVIGDLNDQVSSPPLQELLGRGFQDIGAQISAPSRYTYIYQGVSQSLDYILWRPSGALGLQSIAAVHIDADYPSAWAGDVSHFRRSSDHDPLAARFIAPDYWLRLPFLSR